MAQLTHVGRVIVPVSDQDAAIAFYTENLGCSLTADVPFAGTERWVEVTPKGGGAALALATPPGGFQGATMTGVALDSPDVRGDYEELKQNGVDVDAEMMGGDGTVPLMFFFRDQDGNTLLIVEGAG
jgi:lactoylglutathione lyase